MNFNIIKKINKRIRRINNLHKLYGVNYNLNNVKYSAGLIYLVENEYQTLRSISVYLIQY